MLLKEVVGKRAGDIELDTADGFKLGNFDLLWTKDGEELGLTVFFKRLVEAEVGCR